MTIPEGSSSKTKRMWIILYNDEAEEALKTYLTSFQGLDKKAKLFLVTKTHRKPVNHATQQWNRKK